MPPVSPTPAHLENLLQKLQELETTLFDKADNYIRLVVALGYGGLFAVWSGTKQYLSARLVVLSALLMVISVIVFIAFQILEAGTLSYFAARMTKVRPSGGEMSTADVERFLHSRDRCVRALVNLWYPVFVGCVLSGLGGATILICGFVRSLLTLR